MDFEDSTTALIQSLRNAQLEDSCELASDSPVQIHTGKHRTQSERRAEVPRGGVPVELYTSPSRTGSMETISPHTSRLEQIVQSPSWRRGESFVRQSRDHADDPFVTSANNVQAQSQGKHSSGKLTTAFSNLFQIKS